MYCPQCGQQQISESTRFCSRCGLLVDGLAEWIARGGVITGQRPKAVSKPRTPKRKGISRGAKLMFISAVMLPIFLVMSVAVDFPAPLVVPVTVFFAGLSILLYSVLFGDDTPLPDQQQQPSLLREMFSKNALPPASTDPQMRNTGIPNVRTAELVEPPSVTENTTRLLDRE